MAKRHYSTTTTRSQTENTSAAQHKSEAATSSKASTKWTVFSHPALCYGGGFLLLWTFVVVTYGDVFQHIAAENYLSFDRDTMAYVLRRDLGVASGEDVSCCWLSTIFGWEAHCWPPYSPSQPGSSTPDIAALHGKASVSYQ